MAETARGTPWGPYLVGVVVRVANHKVQPVWFLRAKGTNGCRRLGVFTSAAGKQRKAVSTGPCLRSRGPPQTCTRCPVSHAKGLTVAATDTEPPSVCDGTQGISVASAACYVGTVPLTTGRDVGQLPAPNPPITLGGLKSREGTRPYLVPHEAQGIYSP